MDGMQYEFTYSGGEKRKRGVGIMVKESIIKRIMDVSPNDY